jgi:hypothetical protein
VPFYQPNWPLPLVIYEFIAIIYIANKPLATENDRGAL